MQRSFVIRQSIRLTSQIRLLARLNLFRRRFDHFFQSFVFDVMGAPFRNGELSEIATEFHAGDNQALKPGRFSTQRMKVCSRCWSFDLFHRFLWGVLAPNEQMRVQEVVQEEKGKKMSRLSVTIKKSDQVSGRTQGIIGAMRNEE